MCQCGCPRSGRQDGSGRGGGKARAGSEEEDSLSNKNPGFRRAAELPSAARSRPRARRKPLRAAPPPALSRPQTSPLSPVRGDCRLLLCRRPATAAALTTTAKWRSRAGTWALGVREGARPGAESTNPGARHLSLAIPVAVTPSPKEEGKSGSERHSLPRFPGELARF